MLSKRTLSRIGTGVVMVMFLSLSGSASILASDGADPEKEVKPPEVKTGSAWPMIRHDAQQSGRSEYRGPSSEIKTKWQGGIVSWSEMNSLLVGPDGNIFCTSSDGNITIIEYRYGDVKDGAGVRSAGTPIILKDGRIVSTDGDLTLYVLERPGVYDWKYSFDEEKMEIQSPPTVGSDDTIYLHGSEGRLYAFNSKTGQEKWSSEVYSSSTPAMGKNGTVYTVSCGKWPGYGCLYAVSPNGNVEWKLQLSDQEISECHIAIADDGTIYVAVSDTESSLYAVTAQGTLKWKKTVQGNTTAPAIGKAGEIYIGSADGTLHAFKTDGNSYWEYKAGDSITVAPLVDADGIIYVCAEDTLAAVNPDDGSTYWKHKDQQDITASPILDNREILYYAAGSKVTALYSTAPFRPFDLKASADELNNVTLTWNQASGRNENSFVIEQKIGDEEYKPIGTVATDVTTYKITGVAEGSYTYRVKAVNSGGDSPYSNEAKLTITSSRDNQNGQVRTARFYLNQTNYYQDDAAIMMDVAPVIIEGRTFLPLRYVADALGADVQWIASENKVIIVRGKQTVAMWIDNPAATINGQSYFIDPINHKVRPTLLPPGRTMLPIRFIAESLDCQVEWNDERKEVRIIYIK